eukprot:1648128-Pleurochrysis_carterae.AAC.1
MAKGTTTRRGGRQGRDEAGDKDATRRENQDGRERRREGEKAGDAASREDAGVKKTSLDASAPAGSSSAGHRAHQVRRPQRM